MKISLFQGILFAVFGVAALLGLFVFATYSSTNSGEEGVGSVTIWGTLPKTAFNDTLTAATQIDEALKSVSYVEKDPSTLSTELASAIATGGAPDLVLASQEELLSLTRLLQPIPLESLSARTFADSFIDAGSLFATPGGFYGIPFLVDPLVLYWNKTMFASAGIARPPETWEAVTGMVPAITKLTPNRQITRSLVALGSYDNIQNARGILSAIFLQTNVPMTSPNSSGGLSPNLGISTDSGVPPGNSVLRFYTQFADPSKVSYSWNAALPNSRNAFLSGDLGMYIGYVSEAKFLRDANPNLNFDAAFLPQPGTASARKTYGLVYAFMIPRGAANPGGAFQAAAHLVNDAEQVLASSNMGMAPASISTLAAVPADPIAEIAFRSALYVRGWLSPDPKSIDRIFSAMIMSVINGRSDTESALSAAEGTLGALLNP